MLLAETRRDEVFVLKLLLHCSVSKDHPVDTSCFNRYRTIVGHGTGLVVEVVAREASRLDSSSKAQGDKKKENLHFDGCSISNLIQKRSLLLLLWGVLLQFI